jgi:Mg-chelatase subunit ChlD
MIVAQPIWLLLAIPLVASLFWRKLPGRWLNALRAVTLALVLLAICGLSINLPSRAGTVIVIVDRSDSMPATAQSEAGEAVSLIQKDMKAHHRLGVVSFGRDAQIDSMPGARFSDFTTRTDTSASDLAGAIDLATRLIPSDGGGRIIVFSDGRYTGQSPHVAGASAAARDIAIDYRCAQRRTTNDLAIDRVEAPSQVAPSEVFMMTAWVRSPVSQEISYTLSRSSTPLATGTRIVPAGLSRLTFRDRLGDSGTGQYRLTLGGSTDDPIPENNTARALVSVRGSKPILYLSPRGQTGLSRVLRAGGLDVVAQDPARCDWTLAGLSQYSGLIIDNTGADAIGSVGLGNIAAWVEHVGAGLMMTGGENSYGPGGYYRSALEPVLPVSMELRKEHRKLGLAMVVALDRSGSMMASAGGKTKMDLANLAATEALEVLSDIDEFGCIAVDTSSHTIVSLDPIKDKGRARDKILRIQSQGGGIYVYSALKTSAGMLAKADATTRHIILFADAADAEEPGDYVNLLSQCREANITVSVVGLGTPADSDAAFLRDVAKRGGGECYFTVDATELPRLFAQDTLIVARSSFIEDITPIRSTAGLRTLTPLTFGQLPELGGYNLCYLRPEAMQGVVSGDEYGAPIVAAWPVGAGRVLCYTGETDGKFTGPIGQWDQVGMFYTSLARWVGGDEPTLPSSMVLTQEIVDGVCRIRLHLDPHTDVQRLSSAPQVTTVRDGGTGAPTSSHDTMMWVATDILEVSIPMDGDETILSTVDIPSVGRFVLPPACAPYSPEFAPAAQRRGDEELQRLAHLTGGEQRMDWGGVWEALPERPRRFALAPWLLALAICTFLLEVFERRTGWLSSIRWWAWRKTRAKTEPTQTRKSRQAKRTKPQRKRESQATDDAPAPPPAQPGSAMDDTLTQAFRRAKGRTRRP